MRPGRFLPALALVMALAAPASAQVVQITSSINTNTTWGPTGTVVGSTFWVRNSIAVGSGVTLTIQPGVVVKFDNGAQFQINGTLRAIGTAADSIVFTSIHDDNNRAGDTNGNGNTTVPSVGNWYGITWPDASPDNSRLHYCDVRYAGYGNTAALTFVSATDSVSNSVIRRSYYGVDCQGNSASVLVNTSIEASTLTPIVLDFTATPVFSSLVFSTANNGYDAFGLRGGTLAGTATLPKRGATVGINPVSNVTYVLLSGLTINVGASLTVNPGVVIKPLSGGYIQVNGNLTMNGTAAVGDTITITSINDDNFGNPKDTNNNGSLTAPNRGDWNRIVFAQGATGSISRCRLKFGTNANTQGMIEMYNNNIPVSNCLLSDAAHGIAILGTSTPAVSNLDINNCSSTPVYLSVSAVPVFTNINFLANAITAIGILGEDISVNSRLAVRSLAGYNNITYYLMNGQLRMLSPAILTIDPGVVIKSQLYTGSISIEGGLVANAKPESLIVFTSERDDLYGNPPDTNGDGSTTAPAQGNWNYIRFQPTSNDAVCKLNYCRITYGSYSPFDGYPNSVWITSAAPQITNCFIFKTYYGIRCDGDASPVINNTTFDNCAAAPIVMSVLSDPQIATNNTYTTNVYNALALLPEVLSQNATLKYRPNVGNAASPTFAYLPTGTITVASGVTLTVQPQVVIKPSSSFTVFNVDGALNIVGSNNTTGRVFFTSNRDDALGGDATPTTSSTPQAGDWGNLQFNDSAVDAQCVIRNVQFQFGGPGQTSGVITTNSASPRCARLEFFQNGTCFTFAGNSQPSLDSLTILNCTQLPIVSSLISSPTYGSQITFANNKYLALGILSETIAQNVRTRVGKIGPYSNLNYAPAGNITIGFGAKWTIDPGVVIKFGRVYVDPVGYAINVDGALSAVGKPDSLIIFTSMADDEFGQDVYGDGAATTPQPGQWGGIQFNAVSNDTANVLNHCRFRYGGFALAPLYFISAGPSISNTMITRSSGTAAYVAGNSTPIFTNVDFDSTASEAPVTMSLVSDPVFNNCRFLGNYYTALGVVGENIAQDVLWKIRSVAGRNNMPYLLSSQLTVGLGATVTMQPGVIVKLAGGSIFVQRAFLAEGRTDSLVVFTSYRDDFYGGDTNNDSTVTSPNQSDWSYITIDGTAIDPQVRFKNCAFRYGGSGNSGALRCVNSAPSVDSCLFMYNATGISAEGSSDPVIRGSSLFGNYYNAVNNSGNAFCVKAEGNWWGAASGPNDASAAADLCGLGANAGTGDKVSNNVDYLPFATSSVQNPLLGDVSLNGQVLAYDASLTLQYVASAISLTPLQKLVADVSGQAGISAFDATLILRYVANIIPAFPAASNGARPAPPEALAMARRDLREAEGTFSLALGAPRHEAGAWVVPVTATGTAPVYAIELHLNGAASLLAVAPTDGGRVLHAEGSADGESHVALAATEPLTPGEVAVLRFPDGDTAPAVQLAWGRVNEAGQSPVPPPAGTSVSAFGNAWPNPVKSGTARIDLAVSAADARSRASVRVVDLAGRTVRTLVDGALTPGSHAVTWDLADPQGRPVPAGLYFVRARVGALEATRRLIVVR